VVATCGRREGIVVAWCAREKEREREKRTKQERGRKENMYA